MSRALVCTHLHERSGSAIEAQAIGSDRVDPTVRFVANRIARVLIASLSLSDRDATSSLHRERRVIGRPQASVEVHF